MLIKITFVQRVRLISQRLNPKKYGHLGTWEQPQFFF
jgi:hypothetical protein